MMLADGVKVDRYSKFNLYKKYSKLFGSVLVQIKGGKEDETILECCLNECSCVDNSLT